jgi:hypothetical protein
LWRYNHDGGTDHYDHDHDDHDHYDHDHYGWTHYDNDNNNGRANIEHDDNDHCCPSRLPRLHQDDACDG